MQRHPNRALKNTEAHRKFYPFQIPVSYLSLSTVAGWLQGPCDLHASSSSLRLRSLIPFCIYSLTQEHTQSWELVCQVLL